MTDPVPGTLQEAPIVEGLVPKLGLIPNDGLRPSLMLDLEVLQLSPARPVDWFAALGVPLGMYGNDKVGDCVVAMIIHDYLLSWSAMNPGKALPYLPTTQDALDFYWSINTDHVDRGLSLQTALEKLLKSGLAGIPKPLAFARMPHDANSLRVATSYFVSASIAVEIDAAQMYPSRLWDYVPNSPVQGGHGVCTGQLALAPAPRTGVATWGYRAEMTDAYIGHKVVEAWLVIWPWVYDALSAESAAQLAADFHSLTGGTLPPQVLPAPAPAPKAHTLHIAPGMAVQHAALLPTGRLGPWAIAHSPDGRAVTRACEAPEPQTAANGRKAICAKALEGADIKGRYVHLGAGITVTENP